MSRASALFLSLLLAGCSGGDAPSQQVDGGPGAEAGSGINAIALGEGIGTPNEERVATLGLLNKRNNLTQDLMMKPGETRRVGNVIVKLASCERSLPWEKSEEMGAFVQLLVDESPATGKDPQWRKVFSGWLFANAPSLNVVEHPIYDVWVKDCAMSFPGEEARPSTSASASSAEKPSGSDAVTSPAPTPASPAPTSPE